MFEAWRRICSHFGTMEEPVCLICRMLFNGPLQYSDHLKGKRHRKILKKAHRRQMELKGGFDPDPTVPNVLAGQFHAKHEALSF